MITEPGRYTHWRAGAVYEVSGVARMESDGLEYVVYRREEIVWLVPGARQREMWLRQPGSFHELLCVNPECPQYGKGLARVAGGGDGLCKQPACRAPLRPRFLRIGD